MNDCNVVQFDIDASMNGVKKYNNVKYFSIFKYHGHILIIIWTVIFI